MLGNEMLSGVFSLFVLVSYRLQKTYLYKQMTGTNATVHL